MWFDSNVLILKDRKDIEKVTMDEMHGILTAYEMRIDKENPSRSEATFKASKKTKGNKKDSSKSLSDESDDEEANFVKKHKEGCGTCTKVRYLLNVLNVVK